MQRRELMLLLCGGAVAVPFAARAQQPGRVYRIGMLEMLPAAANARNFGAFQQALRELGYVEGHNLVIEYRSADSTERFPTLANELVGLNVDLLVTRGTPALLAAKSATKTIPVVMAAIADPLIAVASIAHPGGNVTGFSALLNEMYPKRVELLQDAAPRISSIALFRDWSNPAGTGALWTEFETAVRSLGLRPQRFDARRTEDLDRLFDEAVGQHVDALVVSNDTVMQASRRLIAELAVKHRLPTIYGSREFADAGGLMTYGPSYSDLYRRAAGYVDKIFKGAKPGDLPVEQPTRFALVINLKAAGAIGLTIPPSILARADEVIE